MVMQNLVPLAEAAVHKLIQSAAAAAATNRDVIVAQLTEGYDELAKDIHLGTFDPILKPILRNQIPTAVDAAIKYLAAQAASPAATAPAVNVPITTSLPATPALGFGF